MKTTFLAGALALSLLAPAAAAAQTPAQLEANKKLVLEFYRTVWEPQRVEAAKNFIAEDFIEWNPNAKNGLKGFVESFGPRWTPKPVEPQLRNPPAIVQAEGDLVNLIFKRMRPEPGDPSKTYESWWYDTFRIKNGKFVEHWDAALKPPAPAPAPRS